MNRLSRAVLFAAGLFFLIGSVLFAEDVLVVTRPVFTAALQPWVEYRQSQGWTVHLLSVDPEKTAGGSLTPEEIRNKIRSQAAVYPISAVLLIGDGARQTDDDIQNLQTLLPAARVPSEVIQRFGEENHIAADSWYADWDDDGLPEAAVGRLPVRTVEELNAAIEKIIRYETGTAPGEWERNLNFIAGVGGFSPILDAVINRSIRSLLDDLLPGGMNLTLTQADWRTAYCPDPKMFRYLTLDQMNAGPLFWIYMGHGNCDSLDYLQTPAGNFHILEIEDAVSAEVRQSAPILFFFACYTGAFDANRPSLAEAFICQPNGPAAVIAASRTTMPYGMLVFGTELIYEAFYGEQDRLGFILLRAQRRTVFDAEMFSAEKPDFFPEMEEVRLTTRQRLDGTARTFDPAGNDLEGERLDHIRLFNLFGDPLLIVPKPAFFALKVQKQTDEEEGDSVSGYYRTAGETVTVSADSFEADGPVRVELALPANREKISGFRRQQFSLADEERAAFQRTYEEANHRVVASAEGVVRNGSFSVDLAIPPDAAGRYVLRAVFFGPNRLKIGSVPIRIRRPPQDQKTAEEPSQTETAPFFAE